MTTRYRRAGLGVAAAAVILGLNACGSSGQDTGGGAGSNGGGAGSGSCAGSAICFTMQVAVTGAVQVSGTVQIPGSIQVGTDVSSCSAWAKGKATSSSFSIPTPDYGTTLDGNPFRITINTGGQTYHGPGTYPSEFGGAIGVGGMNFAGVHGNNSNGVAVIKADGSGSFTFNNVPSTGGSGSASGSFTWTCS
ncbi:MAG TPA: hypothetical protein VFC09_06920 [Candidatus Dormibacteraeota bacterium]|nr:hypothetical protein [Candidatus Dormibacteraeota bacterium]